MKQTSGIIAEKKTFFKPRGSSANQATFKASDIHHYISLAILYKLNNKK